MKNKKGFTLIELLAVIVILAIIALIAIPIILNMVNESRKSAAKSSLLGYVDSIEAYTGFRQLSEDADISGYDYDLPEMTNGKVTCTKTSSGWNNECKDFFKGVDKKAKGKKPETATVIISEEGKVLSGTKMKFNGYEVTYDGSDANVDGSSSSSSNSSSNNNQPSVPSPVEFSSDSWATIAANTTSNKYRVGDTKTIKMDLNNDNVDETYTLRIANTSTPEVCNTTGYSQTACGFVIEFVDIVEDRRMNDTETTAGGWKETEMVTYLNSDFYNSLPSDLKSVIVPTYPIVSGSGKNQTSENITASDTTKNKIYLLSLREVGFDVSLDNKRDETTDTRILDYYVGTSATGELNEPKRVKKNLNGQSTIWWLRTAASYNDITFAYVSGDHDSWFIGKYSDIDANLDRGVSPAFRIGTN